MLSSVCVACGTSILLLCAVRWYNNCGPNLSNIPTVGYRGILSWITALQFVSKSQHIIERGYRKHKGGLFKLPMLDHWLVVVTDPQAVEDIRKAPDDVLSFDHALFLFLQTDYTAGPQIRSDAYHTALIRTTLSRNMGDMVVNLHDEISAALHDLVPATGEWVRFQALETFMGIVCRVSNRIFVGVPSCRNEDYQKLNIEFTIEIVKAAVAIKAFPEFLRPAAARIFSNVRTCTQRCADHLRPIINHRREKQLELGDRWDDRPNDMLMWCMDEAKGEEQSVDRLALRILFINFGAVHTTSMAFTSAIYRLAEHPDYLQILRQEVNAIISGVGWSKAALDEMKKLDSFIKETLRLEAPGIWAMQRYSLKPFVFSNGQSVPAGTMIACPVLSIHQDEAYYPDPSRFDPWRFTDSKNFDGPAGRSTSTHSEYLAFGHGKHACPGRFFAACELRALLAYCVLNYDIKFEDGKKKPETAYIGPACMPGECKIMFRKRSITLE